MKLFKRIFTFAVMAIFGVITLASCSLTGGNKLEIDMEARVYVSQSYDLVAKDQDGELLSDVKWSISEGTEFAAIQDGKLVPLKAGVFTLEATKGKETVSKKFSAINPVYWDIEYVLNGGEKTEDLFATYTEFDDGKELPTPVRQGYSFVGWYDNASFEGETIKVLHAGNEGRNIKVYAKWELDVYTLEFKLNGGKAHNLPKEYSVENPVESLPVAEKENYTFLGWFTEEGEKVEALGTDVFGVTKLVAKFEANVFKLTYDLAGGSVEGNPTTYTVEDTIELVAPTKLGYTFLGWELNGRLVSKISKGTSGDLSLVAKWELNEYALEFDLAGGSCENLPTSYSIEAPIASLPEATKENYNFLGWYDGETKVEALGAENLGLTKLVAKWAPVSFEISYELNGGSVEGNPATYTVEDEIELVAPTKLGYKFLGWELNGAIVSKIEKGTSGALVLTAKWEVEVYTLEFDLAGGACENLPVSYSVEAPVASLPEASKANYVFLGWYDGETKVESLGADNLGVTKLVAKYEAVKYNISYVLDGGSVEGNPTTYTVEDEVQLVAPTKAGFSFVAWLLNGESITSIAKGTTGDLELVATWKAAGIKVNGVIYETLAEAVAAATNGTVITLLAGEYDLSSITIDKNITIEGPNAGIHGNAERAEEALINMNLVKINAAVTIDGVKLFGTGYLGNTALIGGAKLSSLILKNSVIDNFKNVFYTDEAHEASIEANVTFENNKFDRIGQFYFWIANNSEGAGYKSFNLLNNYSVLSDRYGGVVASNGMISIRHTDNDAFEMNVYGNYFVNPASNSYFRLNTGAGNVMYNTFVGVALFQSSNSSAPINYNENLYLDAEGNVLNAAPEAVGNYGGVADATVLTSEEERADKYLDWYYPYDILVVNPNDPNAYQSFEEAYAAAQPGDHIVLVAGNYTIDGITIDKDIVVEGPNAGVHGNAERAEEAEIKMGNVTIDAKVIIDGVKLVGTGTYGNTAILGGAKLSEFVLRNSFVRYYKNVMYTNADHDANIAAVVTFENNKFAEIGQFFFWIADNGDGAGYKSFNFLNNYTVADSSYAGISASNGMFSIRHTNNEAFVMNIIGNYLVNPTNNSYFRLNTGNAVVEHNTFVGVKLFQSANSTAPINYNENLYLDAEGNVLSAAPTGVSNYKGVADATVLATEEERAEKAQAWIDAFYSSVSYKINYELNGGLLPEGALNGYIASDLPYTLPTPTLEGKVFIGWYTNPEFTGEKLTSIPFGASEDYTLYARFGEEWELKAIYVGENQQYKTLAEALAAAKEGAYIVVEAGTYAEDVTVSTNGVTIYGANHGIAYNGERGEETVINSIAIQGDNITIDGIKSDAIQAIEVKGGNNITITNSIFGGTPTAINQQMMLISGDVNGLYVYNSLFSGKNEGLSYTHYRAMLGNGRITNAEIIGNSFEQFAKTTVYIDGVKLTRIIGNIVIEHNTFNWPGDNWTVYLGSSLVGANTIVNFNYNVFTGEVAQSGASVVNCDATTTVNMIGNILNNVKGNVLQVRGTGSSDRSTLVCANISHNQFNGTSTKVSISASEKYVVLDSNYFFQDIVWSHNNKCVTTNNAATPEEAVAGITKYKVTYELNGGSVVTDLPEYYFANQIANLIYATPTKEAYTFLGWYDNPEFTGDPVTHLGSQGKDIVLYAKFELIPVYNIKYELDGGTAEGLVESAFVNTEIKLPTPEKFGNVFLGWSLSQGSTEYISSFVLTEDTTVYANWVQAEIYTVTYNLNGGSVRYASRHAMLMDFLADYNAYGGYTYTDPSQMPTGAWNNIDFHTFFDSTLADGTSVRDKWLWLAEYLYELSVRDLASNNCNVLGLRDLINKGTISGDDSYGISYAFRAFIAGATVRPGSSYTSVDHTNYVNANGFWEKLSAAEPTQVDYYGTVTLPQAGKGVYSFAGWYDNPEFTGEAITVINGACTLYAKFTEPAPVQSVTIDNKVTEIKRYETLQLTWTLNPVDPTISNVRFSSSDESIATVDDKGLVTAVSTGIVTITVVSDSETKASDSFTMEVYSPDHFEISYVTVSYANVGQTIQLTAEYIKRDGSKEGVVWSSLTPELATVDTEGVVSAIAAGSATIRATLASNPEIYQDFPVTVLEGEVSEGLQFVLDSHESNVFTKYDLGIGAGTPAYYMDIFGSISKILYNHNLDINTQYLAAGDATGRYYTMQSLEFITVHYTGNMGPGADASANANYFVGSSGSTSIHYTTGNDGVYSALSHQYGAWHAGDSGSVSRVGHFEWLPTGVAYDGVDLLDVEFTASDDFYFEINGKKTTVKLPDTYDHNSRNTDHIYNADGTISAQPDYNNWGTTFENRTPESFFNSQDFGIKVVDGMYYMGKTWWSYGQVYEGRICSNGGNYNSIGIESCVDLGSDLWLTWQYTAQLVAYLLDTYGLGLERVKGHHFFDGKDCPQPLLENDLEIWWEFIELVATELKVRQDFADYSFELMVDADSQSFVSENGRILEQPEYAQVIEYTVTINNNGTLETITLASAVNGIYSK